MSKTGIDLFTKLASNVRVYSLYTTNSTVATTDEYVKGNATCTLTLPVLSTFYGTTNSKKIYFFENVSTAANGYVLTISAGTGNTVGNRSTWTLYPGEKLVISATETDTDWVVMWPNPVPASIRHYIRLIATTNDTTAVNLVDASGCPVVGQIVSVVSYAQNGTAANIAVVNANGTVCTIAKGTTAGAAVSATDLSLPTMAVGDALTVASSVTNGTSRVEVVISTQEMTYVY